MAKHICYDFTYLDNRTKVPRSCCDVCLHRIRNNCKDFCEEVYRYMTQELTTPGPGDVQPEPSGVMTPLEVGLSIGLALALAAIVALLLFINRKWLIEKLWRKITTRTTPGSHAADMERGLEPHDVQIHNAGPGVADSGPAREIPDARSGSGNVAELLEDEGSGPDTLERGEHPERTLDRPGANRSHSRDQCQGRSSVGGQGHGESRVGGQGQGRPSVGVQGLSESSVGDQGQGGSSRGGQDQGRSNRGGQGQGGSRVGGQGQGRPSVGVQGLSESSVGDQGQGGSRRGDQGQGGSRTGDVMQPGGRRRGRDGRRQTRQEINQASGQEERERLMSESSGPLRNPALVPESRAADLRIQRPMLGSGTDGGEPESGALLPPAPLPSGTADPASGELSFPSDTAGTAADLIPGAGATGRGVVTPPLQDGNLTYSSTSDSNSAQRLMVLDETPRATGNWGQQCTDDSGMGTAAMVFPTESFHLVLGQAVGAQGEQGGQGEQWSSEESL